MKELSNETVEEDLMMYSNFEYVCNKFKDSFPAPKEFFEKVNLELLIGEDSKIYCLKPTQKVTVYKAYYDWWSTKKCFENVSKEVKELLNKRFPPSKKKYIDGIMESFDEMLEDLF